MPKSETPSSLRSTLIAARNQLQPHSKSNIDPIIFDYKFWSDVKKLAEKERDNSLETVKSTSKKRSTTEGVILEGDKFSVTHKIAVVTSLDMDVFLAKIRETYPEVEAFKLRELMEASKTKQSERHTYTVEEI